MKTKTLLITTLAAMTFWQVNAAELVWLTDLPKAQAQAKAEHKTVLLDFTGSDWCGWCIKFKKEALDTAEFQAYAAKNLVLVEVDFPNKKELSADLKQANAELKTKYGVKGFPTYVLLNADGKEIGRQGGYEKGGAAAFIAKLDGFKKK
jgi:protein disulfide-isomerase